MILKLHFLKKQLMSPSRVQHDRGVLRGNCFANQEDSCRQPVRNRHSRVPRGQRIGHQNGAIWAEEDKLSLHRFKADESYQVGRGPHLARDLGPIESYLSIPEVIRVAKLSGADAIHPGYGLLSESPEFVEACNDAGIIFIGPTADTMRSWATRLPPAIWQFLSACPSCRQLSRCRTISNRQENGRRNRLSCHAESILGRRWPRHARYSLRG